MPPISSIFSANKNKPPVSSINNTSNVKSPVSSALGTLRSKGSTSIFHDANSTQRGSTSIFHPDSRYGQQGSTSIAHVMNEDIIEQSDDDALRDQVRDDLRYRHIRQTMRERQDGNQTKDQRLVGNVGTGRGLGRRKLFVRGVNRMVRTMPAKYKNLNIKDRQYFIEIVRRYAKSLPIGTGFSLKIRNKMKKEIFKDRMSRKINKTDATDFNILIDELPHK